MWTYNNTNELCHHGVLNMKWGIRRYQNKDGSLTKEGQRRRRSNSKKETIKGIPKKKDSSDKETVEKEAPKKIKDLSDDDLKTKINRMQLEKQAYELEKQISSLNPRRVSAGERFAKSLLNDVITPVAKATGKAYLEKMLKEKLGLNEKNTDPFESLKKDVMALNLKKQQLELKKYFKDQKSKPED